MVLLNLRILKFLGNLSEMLYQNEFVHFLPALIKFRDEGALESDSLSSVSSPTCVYMLVSGNLY